MALSPLRMTADQHRTFRRRLGVPTPNSLSPRKKNPAPFSLLGPLCTGVIDFQNTGVVKRNDVDILSFLETGRF